MDVHSSDFNDFDFTRAVASLAALARLPVAPLVREAPWMRMKKKEFYDDDFELLGLGTPGTSMATPFDWGKRVELPFFLLVVFIIANIHLHDARFRVP